MLSPYLVLLRNLEVFHVQSFWFVLPRYCCIQKETGKKTCNQTSCRVSCSQLFGIVALVERSFSNFSFHMGSSEIRMTPSTTWLGFKETPQQLRFRRSKVSAFLCFGITMHWMGVVIMFCERSLSENCDSTLSSLSRPLLTTRSRFCKTEIRKHRKV